MFMRELKMRLVCIEKVQIALWLPTEILMSASDSLARRHFAVKHNS